MMHIHVQSNMTPPMEYPAEVWLTVGKKREPGQLIYLTGIAGFVAGFGPVGAYGVIQKQGIYILDYARALQIQTWRPIYPLHHYPIEIGEQREDMWSCVFEHDDTSRCVEWDNVWTLPGNTRKEAMTHLINGNYLGINCHVSECEMADFGPGDLLRKDL